MSNSEMSDNVLGIISTYLEANELPFELAGNVFVVTIPGEKKLKTTCSLSVGGSAVTINAFVARKPDENAEDVYRWLLEKNLKTYAVAFAIDPLGDIYLAGRVPVSAISPIEIDRIIGCVADYSDNSFNTILELGFATAIRKEWDWRISRGESTANLAAFAHLAEHRD